MQLVAAMMEVVDIEWVRILVGSSHKVYVPRSVHEIYTRGGENPGSEAQTYIRREYLDLVALSVMLKVMLPVWVVFYNRTGASISKSNREKFALRLLWCSQVMAMPAMAKLNTFIQHYIRASNSVEIRLKVAVMGAGSADFTEVMMAGLITTLIAMLDPVQPDVVGDDEVPSPTGSERTIITRLFYRVEQSLGNGPRRGANTVHEKFGTKYGGLNSEDHTSLVEEFRGTGMDEGTKRLLNISLENPTSLLYQVFDKKVTSEIADLFNLFLGTVHTADTINVNRHKIRRIHDCQIAIAMWIMGDLKDRAAIFPIHAREYINRGPILNIIAVAQTYLWYHGFKPIAALLSATALPVDYVIGDTGRDRIRDLELLKRLNDKFPVALYVKGGRRRRERENQNNPIESRVMNAIESLIQPTLQGDPPGFSSLTWYLNIPSQLLREVSGHNQRTFACPREMRNDLARLIDFLY
jgi:hypothetical protein